MYPHEFVDKEETSRLIMEIINKLSEEKRLVILMYYYQEMSTTEIAETLEMPLTVLTSIFSKAAQGVNAPAFSAISQSVLGAPTAVGATA